MTSDFDFWRLLAGIALFLFAMTQLEQALQSLGGRSLATYLQHQAGKRLPAVIGGIVTTALLQSSSVVGLMVLAFTGAGLLPLTSALAMVFGANLGTTLTGWIVATLGFKIEIATLALPLIAIGGAALLFGKGRWSSAGRALLGLGLLLLGLHYMKESVEGLQQLIDFRELTGLASWQFLLFGLAVAAVIQSSSATIMLTLTALNADLITVQNAAAIVIGADLGTTTTLMLGAIKGSAEKKRVAAAHVIFNATNAIIAFAFLPQLLALIAALGLHDPLYTTVAFHSFINVIGLLVYLPLLRPFTRLLERRIRDDETLEARYLSEVSPDVSEAAMVAIEHETSLLIARAIQLASAAFDPMLAKPAGRMPVKHKRGIRDQRRRSFDELYRANKQLGGEIFEFAVRLQAASLDEKASARLEQLLSTTRRAIRSSKSIKDIQHNLVDFAGPRSMTTHTYLERFRESTQEFLTDLFKLRDKGTDEVSFEGLATEMKRQRERHDEIHKSIYNDISDGRVAQTLVFTLLNVNRELMNCQFWLLLALGSFHLSETQAEDLAQLPN